jgi:hypothetical protein
MVGRHTFRKVCTEPEIEGFPAPCPLPIAVRVYPQRSGEEQEGRPQKSWRRPKAMFVFDTETRIDATQRLTFGSYRFVVDGQCLEEGLFCADDLPKRDRSVLKKYVEAHRADTSQGNRQLLLLNRPEFLKKLYKAAYRSRCLLVGFNLPFDLSRLAFDVVPARRRFAGGFSLGLWTYFNKAGCEHVDPNRPRICIKQIDSKRALKGFAGHYNTDEIDRIPEGSKTGEAEEGYIFRGHFLDLRTLAFALTDIGYSLESACKAFGVEHGKQRVTRHGEVTERYIDYNRSDVRATAELAVKLLEEYEKHPISLQATKAYSPASIGKAYLREMGIEPILKRQPNFPQKYLGFAQSAFFGGRTSAHIRKLPVPVVYTDFLSMYPTVNSLMGLWAFVTARRIKVIAHCRAETELFLKRLSPKDLFNPRRWRHLTAFVKVIPDGDILPTRSKYSASTNDWQVAVNHLYAGDHKANKELWFSLPDVVASLLLTGKTPKIVDAFRLEPCGTLPSLKSTKLRGIIEVDPRKRDFFKVVIEERKRLSSRADISQDEKKRLDKALKVLANAASYGIYAEMNRQESEKKIRVQYCGIDPEPTICSVAHPENPGEYCFPPLASLITGAARLMLAFLEHSVIRLGGTYAMEDTDSMAIVATKNGGVISCPGGRSGKLKALSWKQVRGISNRFAALNPYQRDAVPGSILKIEDDNFDPITHKQRQVFCFAISAKRYALFLPNTRVPSLLREKVNNPADKWSEHGLGHLLNPTNLEDEDRDWIAQSWLNIIRKALGLSTKQLKFEGLPAVGRITVSSPAVMRPLANLNAGKRYADQIKPFNFLLSCHVSQFGHPIGTDPERFHLIVPYESNSGRWLRIDWIDQYSGKRYGVTATAYHGDRRSARVKTYGDILTEYEFHPEAKNADSEGNPCGKQTVGLLQRRHIRIDLIKPIGKESNSIEEVESGLVHSEVSVYTQYHDPRRDEWETKVRPQLKRIPLKRLVEQCRSQISRRALIDIRAGRSRPHRKNRALLQSIVQTLFGKAEF